MSAISAFYTTSDTVLSRAFLRYFSRMFADQHKEEMKSTSPFAVTDEIPTHRVVDNAIIEGSGYTSGISSTDHYGFFGGFKGSSITGGGGSWSVDTKVQFDRIYTCPVTGREFIDKDIKEYHDKWIGRGKTEATEACRGMSIYNHPATRGTVVDFGKERYVFNMEDLDALAYKEMSNAELVKFIDDHKEAKS